MTDRGSPLIVDSCVLIDYVSVNPSILSLAARHIGPVIVIGQVLEKFVEFDGLYAMEMGLTVIDPDIGLIDAGLSHTGGLSGCDRMIFALAKRNGYSCWTNDSKLKETCERSGITAYWGLEVMLLLCESRRLSRAAALKTAQGIGEINGFITDEIMLDFRARLDEVP